MTATLTAHVTDVETEHPAGNAGAGQRYRWCCSCDKRGAWKSRARQARQGAGVHVARMERGR